MAKNHNPYLLYYAQEGDDDDFGGGFFSTAAELFDPRGLAMWGKKGVSGVVAEARTELADTTAPKSSIASSLQSIAPSLTQTVGLTTHTSDYLRAIDRKWKGKYQPNGTLYYWDKTKDQMEFIHPTKGHKVIVKKGSNTYKHLMNSAELGWGPTSRTYLPSAMVKKGEKVQVEDVGISSATFSPISGASTELTLFDERMTDLDAADGGFKEKAMAHLKEKWPWYAGGAAAVVGIPLLFMAVGSFNEDWVILLDSQPSGTVSEFYEINKTGNKHGVAPISDTDMAMILALQPGENHNVPSNTGFTVVSRAGR